MNAPQKFHPLKIIFAQKKPFILKTKCTHEKKIKDVSESKIDIKKA